MSGIVCLSAIKRLARTQTPVPDNSGAGTSTRPIVNHSMHSQSLPTIDEIPLNVGRPQHSSPHPPSTGPASGISTRLLLLMNYLQHQGEEGFVVLHVIIVRVSILLSIIFVDLPFVITVVPNVSITSLLIYVV